MILHNLSKKDFLFQKK